ncbi:hypothetical protein GF342_05245 [Candidatus Woesearchaeota archaeon]|nr:hypothetical protein [Candidatus Woesearchaeota archaeon]
MKQGKIEFNAYLLIFVGLILMGMLAVQLFTTVGSREVQLGEKHTTILEAYDQSILLQYEIDRHARGAVERSLAHVFLQGGLNTTNRCGTTGDIVYWNHDNDSCIPHTVYPLLYKTIMEDLDESLEYYNSHTDEKIPKNNFEFYADEQRVTGSSLRPIRIPISDPRRYVDTEFLFITIDTEEVARANVGWYYYQPYFHVDISTGLAVFDHMKTLVRRLEQHCNYMEEGNQSTCVNYQANLLPLNITVEGEDHTYIFDVTVPVSAPQVIRHYDTMQIGYHLSGPLQATETTTIATVNVSAGNTTV